MSRRVEIMTPPLRSVGPFVQSVRSFNLSVRVLSVCPLIEKTMPLRFCNALAIVVEPSCRRSLMFVKVRYSLTFLTLTQASHTLFFRVYNTYIQRVIAD